MARKSAVTAVEAQWGDGNIVEKKGSKRLYFDFYHLGQRVEISSGLKNTPENLRKARYWLDRQMDRMRDGSFRFGQAFPNASPEKLELFAKLEGTTITAKPQHVLFEKYLGAWYKTAWAEYQEPKKTDYKCSIDSQILPFFKGKTFFEINKAAARLFVKQLCHVRGTKKGQPLSRRRVDNICNPLRAIWRDACDEHRWDLPDPFEKIHEAFPAKNNGGEFEIIQDSEIDLIRNDRDPLRFGEFQLILENLDPWYQPVAELMMLTGMIASEVAGLPRLHVKDGYLLVRRSVSRGIEKIGNKTAFRRRDIRITHAIQERLDVLHKRTTGGRRLATSKTGKFLTAGGFYKAWVRAEQLSEVRHRVPYCLRHTFAAWSLIIDMEPLRLYQLMGHASKQMVYEVYGNYVQKLEEDREEILAFFGEDFMGR